MARNQSNNKKTYRLTKPVFLIGFMGAGKSSVARYMARHWGMSSIDADVYLERSENRKIKQIFAEDGEAAFRKLESHYIEQLAGQDPQLISCGGGVVTTPCNREVMKRDGYVVYLVVSADEAASRISNKSSRPLFNDIEAARKLVEERRPLYLEASNAQVDTSNRSVAQIARAVKRILLDNGVLVEEA